MKAAGWWSGGAIFCYAGTGKEVLPMTTGGRIAQKRKALGLSQEGLGEQLGVSRQAIYKWESDSALPEIDKLIALSRLFGVSVGWLLGVEEPPGPGPQTTPEDSNPADAPENSAAELTEQQLQMVEEIVERYTAALPRPLSTRRRRGFKLSIALGALCLVGILYSLFGRLDNLSTQYNSLQNNLARVESSVDNQIGSISGRVEEILKAQNSLVADYGAEIASADLEKNQVTFSVRAVPKTYTQGMAVEFTADNGSGAVVRTAGTRSDDGSFTASLTCPLWDALAVSAVLIQPDGTRSTQLLDQFDGLYSASLPAVDVMNYDAGELLWLKADQDGSVTLPEVYVTTCPLSDGGKEPIGQSEIAAVRVGLFLDKALVTWLDPCQKPDHFHGDYGDDAFHHLPEGLQVTLQEDKDELVFAAVVTDVYGRQSVYSDIPYVLSQGELTWADGSDLSDHDPVNWDYDQ